MVNSQFEPKTYDYKNKVYHFNVEQGTRFELKLDQNTCQQLSDNDVKLYRDGIHLQRRYVPPGQPSITLHGDSFGIGSVDQRYAGNYTIRASNGAQLSFGLKVKGDCVDSKI